MKRKEIYLFVRKWFKLITKHAPAEELLEMLALDDLEMKFPEAKLTDEADFRDWYQGAANNFFDQVHEIKNIEVEIKNNKAELTVLVNWQAHTWEPPAAYSEKIDSDAVQTWQIIEDKTGNLKIKKYIVEALEDNLE